MLHFTIPRMLLRREKVLRCYKCKVRWDGRCGLPCCANKLPLRYRYTSEHDRRGGGGLRVTAREYHHFPTTLYMVATMHDQWIASAFYRAVAPNRCPGYMHKLNSPHLLYLAPNPLSLFQQQVLLHPFVFHILPKE